MKALKMLMITLSCTFLLIACSGTRNDVSTKNYILTTGFENGELVFLGVGGDINGIINPTLHADPGETITVMLVNGGEGEHDIYFPNLKIKSERVTEKGKSVSVTFTVPNREVELEYIDSVANHAQIGMVGVLQIGGTVVSKVPEEANTSSAKEVSAQVMPQNQNASGGEEIFNQKCTSCHTIGGGKLVGPDLKGVTTLRDTDWLSAWLKAPDKVLASGDPIATEMLAEFNNISMPNMALSDSDVAELIAYFQQVDGTAPVEPEPAPTGTNAAASESTTSQQLADNVPQPSAIAGDPLFGEQIFQGKIDLQNGGVACIACHSVEGSGVVGGGALGPNLTHVYTRYGQDGLAAALGSLPFPTMQGVFGGKPLTASEQADLLAYFASADRGNETPNQQNFWMVLGSGSALTVVFFIGMIFFWPRQRMSIAQRLRKYGKL
jgi:mono/diheme cytochrome c family protein